MDTWPMSLQQKMNVDGFQYSLGVTTVSTDMDVGPSKVRSRFTDGIDGYQLQHTLDFDDIALFKTFYKTTIANGTLPFLFTDPFTLTEETFRFTPGQVPVVTPLGGRTFTLAMVWDRLP